MDHIDGKAIAKKLVELTSSLKSLPATDYAGRLHYKAALSRRAMEFRDQSMLDMGSPWPGYDDRPGTPSLAGYAIPDTFNYLAQTAVARAMKDLGSQLQSKVDMVICDEVYTDQMATLAYLCFTEHINATLREKPIEVYDEIIGSVRQVKDLRDLRMLTWKFDAGHGHNVVGDVMEPLLTYLPFIAKIIEEDTAHEDSLRSMSILFLADFMTGDPYTAEVRKDFVFKSSFEILRQWSRALWERKGKGNPSETKKIVAFCGRAATAVYRPSESSPIPSTYDVTTKVYHEITKRDPGHDSYIDEVRQAINDLIESDLNTWKSIYQGLSNAWSTSSYSYWKDAVKKGMAKDDEAVIKQWVTDGYFWEDELPYGSKKMLKKYFARNGAYIAAGNVITLADGSYRKVETLKVNDMLLTSAKGDTDPVKVSRDTHPMELTAGLISFNGEEPFATPAQVFHTTTGLRAVNPQAAMKQNPWAKIGRLAVGHILYRHKENPSTQSDYELIEVKSIERTTPEKRTVFALALNNGVRLHHVNRYLANVNDPEIRLEDVSALLSKFSAADQMRILSSAKEINPLLSTFDTQTIWERLQIEMLDAKSQAIDPWKGSSYSAPFSSRGAHAHILQNNSILHLAKSYKLVPVGKAPRLPINSLPGMKLLDGNLLLDDQVQSRAAVNEKNRTVSWTRKIPGKQVVYEHGQVEIFAGDETGSGSTLYSPEAHPSSLDQGDIIKFTVSSSTIDSVQRKSRAFPMSLLSSSASPVASLTGGIRSKWDMTLDKKEWKKGEKRDKPEDPVKFGTIFTGTHVIPEEVNIFGATVPILDEILEAINKGRKFSGKQVLDSLYTSFLNRVVEKDEDDDPTVVERRFIKVNESSTLLFLSDQGPDSTSPFNLTFKKNLGIDVTLPVLFQSMYFDVNFEGDEVSGGLFIHDPTMRENKGSRYFVNGEWQDEAFGDKADYRLRVSKHFANISTPGTNISNSAGFQPAGVTALLAAVSPISVEKLYKMPYNSNDANEMQQRLINEAMFYHMKDDDRKTFTNKEKPDPNDIGHELTDKLPDNLSKWLKNVYAPAFITRSITQIDKFKEHMKSGQAEKVWYWWSGNGKKCLSNTKEFNQLNRISSIRAMKQLYKKYLDQDAGTSRDLAQKLYKVVSSKPKMDQILEEDDRGDNINKICAIMYTLHPEEDYSGKWFRLITDRAIAKSVNLPFIKDKDGKYVQDYLDDAMSQLITKILTNDPKFVGPVRDQLEKDLIEFMEKNQINKQWSIEKKVSACIALMSAFTVEVAQLLVITGSGLARAFGGSKLFQLAGKLVEKAEGAVSKIPMGTKIARGLGALCVVGYFVGQVLPLVSVIKGWDKLTPAQRAIGILEAIRAVLNATERAVQEFNAWRNPDTKESVRATESAILDGSLSHEITQPVGEGLFELGEKLNPEGGVKANMADMLKEGGMPSNDEHISGDSEIWSEEKTSTPEKLRPMEEEAASKLSATSKWIRGLNIVLGFAVAAAMTYSLIEEWDKLTDVGKVINTLSVIVQILAVVVDVLDLAVATGLIVSATLSVAIPIIGAVLALVGIGLMIVSLFVDMYATEPATSPVDDFISNVVGTLTADWADPPDPKLSYYYSKKGGSSEAGTVTVSGENKTSETVAVLYSQMSVYVGHTDTCLFSDDSFHLSTDKEAKDGGAVSIAPENLIRPTLVSSLMQEKEPNKYWVYNLSLKGKSDEKTNPMGSIILEKGKKLSAAWAGKLKSKSKIDIIEVFTNGDKAHKVLEVTF